MSNSKLTRWFPADVKPVHNGKYQVQDVNTGDAFHAYWHTGYWRFSNRGNAAMFMHQDRKWRGLAQDPKVKK